MRYVALQDCISYVFLVSTDPPPQFLQLTGNLGGVVYRLDEVIHNVSFVAFAKA